jgi:hypothetical protein
MTIDTDIALAPRAGRGIAEEAVICASIRVGFKVGGKPEHEVSHRSGDQGLSGLRVVVQCDTYGASVMPVVLADDGLAAELPQSRVMIAASCHQVR